MGYNQIKIAAVKPEFCIIARKWVQVEIRIVSNYVIQCLWEYNGKVSVYSRSQFLT